jgi:hypothetical protein
MVGRASAIRLANVLNLYRFSRRTGACCTSSSSESDMLVVGPLHNSRPLQLLRLSILVTNMSVLAAVNMVMSTCFAVGRLTSMFAMCMNYCKHHARKQPTAHAMSVGQLPQHPCFGQLAGCSGGFAGIVLCCGPSGAIVLMSTPESESPGPRGRMAMARSARLAARLPGHRAGRLTGRTPATTVAAQNRNMRVHHTGLPQ